MDWQIITDYIKQKTENNAPANIVIAGRSCSGKTTLAKRIEEVFGKTLGVCVMHEDDYFKDLKDFPKSTAGVLADHTDAFWTEEFAKDAKCLIEKGIAYSPVYDLATNTRTDKTTMKEKALINVFEGLHTITLLNGMFPCLKIYMEPGQNICLERRIERDGRLWKLNKDSVISYWNRCIRPVSEYCIEPQAKDADIILR